MVIKSKQINSEVCTRIVVNNELVVYNIEPHLGFCHSLIFFDMMTTYRNNNLSSIECYTSV